MAAAKAMLVAVIATLPTWTWDAVSAVARFAVPGFRRA